MFSCACWACRARGLWTGGGSYLSKFLLFYFIIFYIGAWNSSDKLVTIYIPNNPKNPYTSFTFYTQSQKHGIKVQTKKGKLYIYFHFLLGAGGGRGEGGSRVVEGVGMGESAFHGPQMFNEDRYVVSLSRSILIEYAIQPWLVSL